MHAVVTFKRSFRQLRAHTGYALDCAHGSISSHKWLQYVGHKKVFNIADAYSIVVISRLRDEGVAQSAAL